MANYLYNGVELPDINSVWDKETYPYAYIQDGTNANMNKYYRLYLTSFDVEANGSSDPDYISNNTTKAGAYAYYFLIDGVWAFQESVASGGWLSVGSNDSLCMWCNDDILRTDDTVYLAASDPVPVGGSKLTLSVGGVSYNGVVLPALPEWDKTKYPYASFGSEAVFVLTGSELGDASLGNLLKEFSILISSVPLVHDEGATYDNSYVWDGATLCGPCSYRHCSVAYDITPNGRIVIEQYLGVNPAELEGVWSLDEELTLNDGTSLTPYNEVDGESVLWANHDILYEDGSTYFAGSAPVVSEVTSTTADVTFTCSDLDSTESVYQIYAWVYKTADGLDTTITPTWTSDVFAGTSHSESHTFEGLSPNTEYSVYGVIYANGAGTDQNATATFTTAEGEANYTLTVTNQIVTADDCLFEVQVGGLPTYNVDDTSTWFQLKATLSNGTVKETGVGSSFDTGSFYFDGLEPETEYSITFELFRVNSDGSTGASTGITLTDSFTTEASDPFADSRIGPVNETVSENTFSLDIEYRNLPDPSTIVEGDTGYIIKGYTDQGDEAVFEAIEGYGDGMVSGYFSDLEYGTDYIATFVLCHQDGTSTGVTCETTFTTERKGYDRDSFLAGLASGLAMTGATAANTDNNSWCQGYIVGEAMRMGL